jgi:hypothetical protein
LVAITMAKLEMTLTSFTFSGVVHCIFGILFTWVMAPPNSLGLLGDVMYLCVLDVVRV